MQKQIQSIETLDIEEVIAFSTPQKIEDDLPQVENDMEAIALFLQDVSSENHQLVEAELHNQIDPSYQ